MAEIRCALVSLLGRKREEMRKTRIPDIGDEPDISPEIGAERAEARIFEESLREGRVAGSYRKRTGDIK